MAIVKVTPALVAAALAATDWQAIDAQSDSDIASNVARDPDAPPILTGGETAACIVRTVRKRLGLSQTDFAARFHVPVGTLRDWEQNRRQPDAPALAYLRVIAREPDMVARALEDEINLTPWRHDTPNGLFENQTTLHRHQNGVKDIHKVLLASGSRSMAQPHKPSASEIGLLVVLLVQRYALERGKDVSRFRLARNSLRRLAIRARLRDSLVDDWVDIMALEHGWLVFAHAEEFLLLKTETTATWTKIATKRCDDLVKRLRTGDRTALDDAEAECEFANMTDEEDE